MFDEDYGVSLLRIKWMSCNKEKVWHKRQVLFKIRIKTLLCVCMSRLHSRWGSSESSLTFKVWMFGNLLLDTGDLPSAEDELHLIHYWDVAVLKERNKKRKSMFGIFCWTLVLSSESVTTLWYKMIDYQIVC